MVPAEVAEAPIRNPLRNIRHHSVGISPKRTSCARRKEPHQSFRSPPRLADKILFDEFHGERVCLGVRQLKFRAQVSNRPGKRVGVGHSLDKGLNSLFVAPHDRC
jgi:hypothetical protein